MSGARPDPGPGAPADRGAQRERTRLAWRRTTLTFAVTTALALRGLLLEMDPDGPRPVAGAAAVAALLAFLAFLTVAHRRVRELDSPAARQTAPRAGLVVRAALCVVAVAVLATALPW